MQDELENRAYKIIGEKPTCKENEDV